MRNIVQTILTVTVLLLILGTGGCMSDPARGHSSAYYDASCRDMVGLLQRTASGDEWVLQQKSYGGHSGYGNPDHDWSLDFNIRCMPEAAERLLRLLKAEEEKLAQQVGVKIVYTGEEKDVRGRLIGFRLCYTFDRFRGKFSAKMTPLSVASKTSDKDTYELKMRIEE